MQRVALGGVGRRHAAAAILAAVSLGMAVLFASPRCSLAAGADSAPFAEGWRKEVALTDPNGGNKTPHCVAWIYDGWLIVERRDTADDLEWQIVLAEVGENDEPPTIEPNPKVAGGVRLDYRSGRFFIHDDWGRLRCRRQKKTAEMPWPPLSISPNDGIIGENLMGKRLGELFYYGRTNHGWQFIARGAEGGKAEYVLRMYCLDVGAFQLSSRSDRGGGDYTVGAAYRTIDSSTFTDDGELLVARRMSEATVAYYRAELEKLLGKRKELIGAPAPAIPAAKRLNDDSVVIDGLGGKAALVYFAGAYSKYVAKELSALNDLYGKYHDRGLEIAAVIPLDDEEVYAAICEKRGWSFPVAVDDRRGVAAQRFYVTDTPSYFLIGRDGKIAVGLYQDRVPIGGYKPPPPLPDAEEIERLLAPAANE